MKRQILKALKKIERENTVKILWAIESGSRAWGFASEDSDFDIRCMHVGKIDDYLSLTEKAKQINFVENNLDVESWDIRKFGELSLKSNPQIAEWLRSPVVYISSEVKDKFKELFDKGCSLEYLRTHYLRMAKQNYHKYMGSGVSHSCKKYLYVLRGIACAEYIKKENELPPLPYKDVISYLPEFVSKFFEKCIIQKNQTEKALIIGEEKVLDFINISLMDKNLKEKVDTSFSKKKELDEYIIKVIKKQK